ncbi:MAG: YihY family inner membrane protein [Caldithrix sp.]|nr:YihY family inner membrane protein [Caldithrix sp.]
MSKRKLLKIVQHIREASTYYLVNLYKNVGRHHVFLYSGGLAFSLFICLMPFILILFSVLGLLLNNESIQIRLISVLDTIIPYSRYTDPIKDVIFARVQEIQNYRAVAGSIGVVGLFVAASGFFSSLRTILNKIFGVSKGKHMVVGKLRDMGMIFFLMFVFLVMSILLPLLNSIFNYVQHKIGLEHPLSVIQAFILHVSVPLTVIVIFYLFYKMIPYEKIDRKTALVSAFSAAILWKLAEELFRFFITHFASLNRIYGAYMFLIVVVFWIYYSGIVFIVAAEIGQLYRLRRDSQYHEPE